MLNLRLANFAKIVYLNLYLLRNGTLCAFSPPPPPPPGVEEEEQPTAPPAAWDFGLHRSDAGKVCGEHMAGGGGGGLVNTGHPWHPGRLLFYGRAELKQSDHR